MLTSIYSMTIQQNTFAENGCADAAVDSEMMAFGHGTDHNDSMAENNGVDSETMAFGLDTDNNDNMAENDGMASESIANNYSSANYPLYIAPSSSSSSQEERSMMVLSCACGRTQVGSVMLHGMSLSIEQGATHDMLMEFIDQDLLPFIRQLILEKLYP